MPESDDLAARADAYAESDALAYGYGRTPAPTPASAEDEAACTCRHYVVDYSDPERYHTENVDREDDPSCPVHGAPAEDDAK